ncbi:hypothetical protein NCC49_001900 [Naganishia albida]|nr:hypothetical protein NCC49_001900 [Naganishia albida]
MSADIQKPEAKGATLHQEFARQDERKAVQFGEMDEQVMGGSGLKHMKDERVVMTDQQSRLVRRKIDRNILPILVWVYFLQILDKSCVGYAATFGLREDANLTGDQYSTIGSAGYWAQLAWQPFSAYLIVKVPPRILMPCLVSFWGISMIGMAFSTSFGPLLANRFLLGLFEAGCLPLFTVIATSFYRKIECTWAIAMFYSQNGIANIFGSLLAWAVSFADGSHLHVYQVLFLIVGLMTVLTAPYIIWKLDNSPETARFLTPQERLWAVERLRDNNTGIVNRQFKWYQAVEACISPLLWLFVALTFCVNTGGAVVNVFGPLIVKSFGFTSRVTILLNMPFGFLQTVVILASAWAAMRWKSKGIFIVVLMIPCCIGSGLLYGLGRESSDTGPLLFGYYLLSALFGANPLILSFMAGNIAGHTKKSICLSLYGMGSATGNIVGPLLFKSKEAPKYAGGLRAILGIFVATVGCVAITEALLWFLNKQKEKERVANGKPAKIQDLSMNSKYEARQDYQASPGEDGETEGPRLGDNAFADLTDRQNDEFVYTY